jgi:hypothetical protein
MKKRKCGLLTGDCDEIILNIGGTKFSTCRITLKNAPKSVLFARFCTTSFKSSSLFIDRDPTLFRHILNWLRSKKLDSVLDTISELRDLETEADFFCLIDLKDAILKRCQGIRHLKRIQKETFLVEASNIRGINHMCCKLQERYNRQMNVSFLVNHKCTLAAIIM